MYLVSKGWQPKCGRDAYIKINFPFVLENLKDNPDYLDEASPGEMVQYADALHIGAGCTSNLNTERKKYLS